MYRDNNFIASWRLNYDAEFDRQRAEDRLGLSIPSSARAYLDERLAKLRETLDLTEALGRAGELPEVELSESGMKISSLSASKMSLSARWVALTDTIVSTELICYQPP